MDERSWFSETAKRKVTATEIAEHLGVSRNTVNKRLADGLSADDLIVIARAVGVSPVDALIELGPLTYAEVYEFLEGDGKLLETSSEAELSLELAQRLNPSAAGWGAVVQLGRAVKPSALQTEDQGSSLVEPDWSSMAARKSAKGGQEYNPNE